MNTCKIIRKNFIALIEGTASDAVRQSTLTHMQNCGLCSQLYKKLEATYQAFDKLPAADPGPFFHTRVAQRLKNKEQRTFFHLTPFMQRVSFGLITATGIFVGVMIGQTFFNPTIENSTAMKNETLRSYANEYYLYGTGSEENIRTLDNNE